MDAEALVAFLEKATGKPEAAWEPDPLSPDSAMELLWGMYEYFPPSFKKYQALKFNPRFESEADNAILAFVETPESQVFAKISAGALRVLLERNEQAKLVMVDKIASGSEVTVTLPKGLSESQKLCALMLFLLLRMELPWPPGRRSASELSVQNWGVRPSRH